ncbi:trehalose-phosphatase [Microbacterium sp. LRZ72]|nr:trehalose-phosphatase [Microbacterium sp. LRZ72]
MRLAHTPRLLIALDFDGTMAPLGDEPMAVRALPAAQTAVAGLARLPETFVAFVSGRTLADLRVIAEHDDASVVHLAGSHGAEYWHPADAAGQHEARTSAPEEDSAPGAVLAPRNDPRAEPEGGADAAAVLTAAEAAVAEIDGAWIEDKAYGFGLHTRLAAPQDARRAHELVDEMMSETAPQWRRRSGRDILEFSWRHEGKDAAVAALRESLGATAVLFAGDDVTDEDALASLGPDDVGVRVGAGETVASVRVDDPAELAEMLARLARMRAAAQE